MNLTITLRGIGVKPTSLSWLFYVVISRS